MLAPSALARRLTAPRKHSRPVLSEVCPLLYKTVGNPAMHLKVCVKCSTGNVQIIYVVNLLACLKLIHPCKNVNQNFNFPYPPFLYKHVRSVIHDQWSIFFCFRYMLDRNECEDGSAICPANSDCLNTDGSYNCRCTEGYQLNEAGNCIGL